MLVDKVFSGYRIVASLSSSPTSTVYLAQSTSSPAQEVVLKVLDASLFTSEQDQEAFLQEGEFLARLKHSHILPILDVGVERGLPYIVSEYAPNGSLRDRLNSLSVHLPTEEAIQILSDIGTALQYAHEQNILHCNIKPENILFNAAGEALLADFGLVSIPKKKGRKTKRNYQAPEQAAGLISKEGDQYALGRVAYELFTGQVAPSSFRTGGVSAPLIPDSALTRHIEVVLRKATARDPEERFQSVAVFVRELTDIPQLPTEKFQAIRSDTDGSILASRKAQRKRKRRKALVRVFAVVLSFLVIGATIFALRFFVPFLPGEPDKPVNTPAPTIAPTPTEIVLTTPTGISTSTVTPLPSPLATRQIAQASTPTPIPTKNPQPTPQPSPTATPTGERSILSGAQVSIASPLDLGTAGTLDWAHWGLNTPADFNHKDGVVQQISNVSIIGGGSVQRFPVSTTSFFWSDGIPTRIIGGTSAGIYISGVNNGFSLTLPASTTTHTLYIYMGVYQGRAQFSAAIKDTNRSYTSNALANGVSYTFSAYKLTYRGSTAGQVLTISITLLKDYSKDASVILQAATLS
jgi:serine/threonine protein kinase